MKNDIVAYPACFKEHKGSYAVYVPDLNVYTDGKDIIDAMHMARDIIGLHIVDLDNMKKKRPKQSSFEQICKMLNKIDNGFKSSYVQMIDVNVKEYRKTIVEKTVRRNVTIPEYLNDAVNEAGINVSKLLTDILKKKYGSLV